MFTLKRIASPLPITTRPGSYKSSKAAWCVCNALSSTSTFQGLQLWFRSDCISTVLLNTSSRIYLGKLTTCACHMLCIRNLIENRGTLPEGRKPTRPSSTVALAPIVLLALSQGRRAAGVRLNEDEHRPGPKQGLAVSRIRMLMEGRVLL